MAVMTPIGRQIILNTAGAVIGVSLVLILALCLQALFEHEVPSGNKDALLVVIGMLTVKIGTIVDFFYGNSEASKRQAETISTLVEAQPLVDHAGGQALKLKSGETATATATPRGTIIEKEDEAAS